MSKQYRIKWTEADLKELNRVVKNFNSKLARLEKKDPKNANKLPKFSKEVFDPDLRENVVVFTDRLSVNQLKEMINTRQDFNREINALKRFSRRGAEKLVSIDNTDNNIEITKWQKEEMNRRLVYINKRREARRDEISKIDIVDKGESAGYKFGAVGMGSQALKELNPITISYPSMTNYDMKWKFRTILKESQSDYFNKRDELLRLNYIKSLEENFNSSDIQDVIDKIKNMNPSQFLAMFYAQGGNFEFSYPPDEEQYQGYVEQVKSIWKIE